MYIWKNVMDKKPKSEFESLEKLKFLGNKYSVKLN